ncbi:MAG TPA: hypothetical protein VE783_00495 [Candidatus Limnocylindrales bacterium]|nr:hypothetical protein [Candidatus Limnocylindrales bacterium]
MKRCAILLALLVWSCVAFAQTGQQQDSFTTLNGGIRLRAIAGVPFSADMVKETIKILPDGSQVPVITKGKLFRDPDGRTRTEVEIATAGGVLQRVTIVDPVQRIIISLDAMARTALVTPMPATASTVAPAKVSAAVRKARNASGTEPLGVQSMESFEVTGSRRTLPAAAGGSANHMGKSTVEAWFSPELKIELEVRTVEPGASDTVTRLQNIVTASPDAALFQVPADYKAAVRQEGASR